MTNPLALHKTAPHWTDPHILFEENDNKFIAYDESGLEHSKWDTLNEARDALVLYAANELGCAKTLEPAGITTGGSTDIEHFDRRPTNAPRELLWCIMDECSSYAVEGFGDVVAQARLTNQRE